MLNLHAVGKRKTAIARIYLRKPKEGKGKIVINKIPFDNYFPRPTSKKLIMQPLELLSMNDQYDILVNVKGGGKSAQADAVKYAISKAFNLMDIKKNRLILKKAGFLTRDSRIVERKKYGLSGARKRYQYSKR